jgi:hypothetical protein
MCFSATANFVGSAALGATGVITLTKVKHRREQQFAALPRYLRFISLSKDSFGWDSMEFSRLRWRTMWASRSWCMRRDSFLFCH